MAEVLALEHLYLKCRDRFRNEGTDVPFLFGWRAVSQQMVVGRRIVWVPGDANGNVGSILGPQTTNKTYDRALLNLEELCTVYVHSEDTLAEEDELRQYRAVRLLYDGWLRAMYLAARGTYRILSQRYEAASKERRFGATIVVTFSISAVVPDTAYEAVSPSSLAITGGVVPATPGHPNPDALSAEVTGEFDHSETDEPANHSETHVVTTAN